MSKTNKRRAMNKQNEGLFWKSTLFSATQFFTVVLLCALQCYWRSWYLKHFGSIFSLSDFVQIAWSTEPTKEPMSSLATWLHFYRGCQRLTCLKKLAFLNLCLWFLSNLHVRHSKNLRWLWNPITEFFKLCQKSIIFCLLKFHRAVLK